MKKRVHLVVILITLGFVSYAQVPQFICYQAVATDPSGRELISQNIRMRLTVLKSSTAGTEEWIETQNVTTDGFGLFDLMIGNGTRAGGAQTLFSGIKWGSDKYFLKVEMDVAGGNNFVLMGTNQLVSVPYALYSNATLYADSAGKANTAVYAQTAVNATNAVNAQTATRALTAGKADSATFATSANSAVLAQTAVNATNATNAINAMRASTAGRADTATFAWLADSSRRARNAIYSNFATKADTSSFAWYADSSRRAYQSQRTVLADSALRAQVAQNAINSNHALVADSSTRATYAWNASHADTASVAYTSIADKDTDPSNEIQKMSVSGGIITLTNPFTHINDTVNLNTQNFIPLPDFYFPEGAAGDAMLITSNYTVPAGKTLYVTAATSDILLAGGVTLINEPNMPIIPEGTFIQSCYCSGLLSPGSNILPVTNPKKYVTPIILDFSTATFTYTVPPGKTLIIKSGSTSGGIMGLDVDGASFNFYTSGKTAPRLVFIPTGKTIKKPAFFNPSEKFVTTGYLLSNQF